MNSFLSDTGAAGHSSRSINVFVMMTVLLTAAGLFLPIVFSWVHVAILLTLVTALLISRVPFKTTNLCVLIWMVCISILGCISYFWSIEPAESLERGYKNAALLLTGAGLLLLVPSIPEPARKIAAQVLPYIVFVALAGLAIEYWFGFPLTRLFVPQPCSDICFGSSLNKNIVAAFLLLPMALHQTFIRKQWILMAGMLVLTILCAMKTESQTSVLVLAAMACAAVLIAVPMRLPVQAAGIAAGVLMLLFPWIAAIAFDFVAGDIEQGKVGAFMQQGAANMRLEIWDFIAHKIMSNPLIGFGLDATRYVDDFRTDQIYFKSAVVMHPHNLPLQVWIEFGLPGIALALMFLGFIIMRICALPRPERRMPFILLCGILCVQFLSWSIWAGWWLGTQFMVCFWLGLTATKTNTGPVTS